MTRVLIGAAVLCSVVSCGRHNGGARERVDAKPDARAGGAVGDATITLERTACFGTCPVYRVSIAGNGAVTFEGRRHVRREGVATARIGPAQVRGLLAAVEEAGFFSLADRYEYGEPTCAEYATDNPSAITSIAVGGRTKTVRHDYGCSGAPEQLTVLEARIDSIANSNRWIGAR